MEQPLEPLVLLSAAHRQLQYLSNSESVTLQRRDFSDQGDPKTCRYVRDVRSHPKLLPLVILHTG